MGSWQVSWELADLGQPHPDSLALFHMITHPSVNSADLFSWQQLGLGAGQGRGGRERGDMQGLQGLGSELAHCHFRHIPWAIACHEASPESRDGEIDSTS